MTKNECTNNDVRDLLALLASGGQVESSAMVEAHIAACDACREELALLKTARQALLRAPAVDAARIARAVPAYGRASRTDPKVVSIDSRRSKAPAWRIAAAALLVVAAGGTALAVRQAGGDLRTAQVAVSGDSGTPVIGATTGPFAVGSTVTPSPAEIESGTLASVLRTDTGTQMTFGGGLDDLSEEQLVALLAALEDGESLAPVEPEEALPSMAVDTEEES